MNSHPSKSLAVWASIFLAGWLTPGLSSALTRTVTDPADSGPGTLREAISIATGGDEIVFSPALASATITLQTDQLSIDRDLTIDGSAAPGIEISGNDAFRIFRIDFGVTADLKNLRITHGFSSDFDGGGAIDNLGTVRLDDCTVSDNSAVFGGAIDSDGTVELNRCQIVNNTASDSGGGIYNFGGTLTITDSSLIGNQTGESGGGINNEGGTVTVTNSSIASNTADSQGGGIQSTSLGAQVTLTHATVAGNMAGTLGGGIQISGGTLHLENTIVGSNQAAGEPDISKDTLFGSPSISSTGAVLISDNSSVDSDFPASGTVGTPGAPLSAFLAPANDYGDGSLTRPPLPGSPAIGTAVLLGTTPALDQRGTARPDRLLPDIGAVETFLWRNLPLIDTDLDNIDDRIEPALGLTVGADDSLADTDQDGQTDGDEIGSMTHPFDATSLLQIDEYELTDPSLRLFRVRFPSFPGLGYSIEGDQNLDYQGPDRAILGTTTATGFQSEMTVILRPDRDFPRLVRD